MFSNFNEESQRVLINSKSEMVKFKHSYIGSEHLFLSILSSSTSVSELLFEYGINYEMFKDKLLEMVGVGNEVNDFFIYTPVLKRIIETAMLLSKDSNNIVTLDYLLFSIFEEKDCIAMTVLKQMNINVDNLFDYLSDKIRKRKKINPKKYTIEEYGIDLTKQASENYFDPVVGRDNEISKVIEVLCRRSKNNPLLIGEAGVGKTAIVEELSRLISIGDVPDNLKNKRIISIAMASLVSGTKYRGEFEERITKILKEIENNDEIILFIDEIHTLMGAGGAEGAIDASNILKPMLARGNIRLIGATTNEEYRSSIEKDKAMARRFQTIYISEPNEKMVYNILLKLKPIYESFHNVSIGNDELKNIVDLTNKYFHDRKQPDKAIDILDEVCSYVSINNSKQPVKLMDLRKKLEAVNNKKKNSLFNQDFDSASYYNKLEKRILSEINSYKLKKLKKKSIKVNMDDIYNVISYKTKIPINSFNKCNKKFIDKLKLTLDNTIIGQCGVSELMIRTTKRIKYGLDNNKPKSFLFVGPSGVGKTKMAVTYAKCLYGEAGFIKIDMSEYSDSSSITKLIGSNPGYVGYDNGKNIFDKIRSKPNCVIILDEIDKAHPVVINLFLSILDEGKIIDNNGNEINFNNNIIIMTSNSGYNYNDIGFVDGVVTDNYLKSFFSVEFINRIQNVVRFNKLTRNDIETIMKQKLKFLRHQYRDKGIKLSFNSRYINNLIDKSDYENYGARKIDKLIDDYIIENIIDNLVSGNNEIYVG